MFLGLNVRQARVAVGCDRCAGTGYGGRTVLAEMLLVDSGGVGQAILARSDAATLERAAIEAGMVGRWQRAARAVEEGVTSPAEVRRVLGFSDRTGPTTVSF
jgi:type II secretory ATPase GspE/PulE/Tfp pilus assembly ATPase PilB-like protein